MSIYLTVYLEGFINVLVAQRNKRDSKSVQRIHVPSNRSVEERSAEYLNSAPNKSMRDSSYMSKTAPSACKNVVIGMAMDKRHARPAKTKNAISIGA